MPSARFPVRPSRPDRHRVRRGAVSGRRLVLAMVVVMVLLSLILVLLRRDWQRRHPRPAPVGQVANLP